MIPQNAPLLSLVDSRLDIVAGSVSFDYQTPSPLTIIDLKASDWIDRLEVVIDEPFDDPLATLSMGTVAEPELVLTKDDIETTLAATYGNDSNFLIPVDEILRLTIDPFMSTQGSGVVFFLLRR